jgi:hypothetical protein
MLDELECPDRDLRISAVALQCRKELEGILEWLRAEVASEIEIETMFDGGGSVIPPLPDEQDTL